MQKMKIILLILAIGLLFVFVAIAIAVALLRKGASFLFGGHRHHRYSSSGGWKNPLHPGGHHSYGHGHYRNRHSSHSFFSS